jgi:hypothetical protein
VRFCFLLCSFFLFIYLSFFLFVPFLYLPFYVYFVFSILCLSLSHFRLCQCSLSFVSVHLFRLLFFCVVSVCLNFISIYPFPLRAIPSPSFFFRFLASSFFLLVLLLFSLNFLYLLSFCFLNSRALSVYYHVFKYTFHCFFPSFVPSLLPELLCTFAVPHFKELYRATVVPSDRVLASYRVNKRRLSVLQDVHFLNPGIWSVFPRTFLC